jgi:hypothetical protein
MSKKLTQKEAIENIKSVWGDKYDLSQVKYKDAKTPLKLTCKEHGEFSKNLNKLTGKNASGCPKCGLNKRAESKTCKQETVIDKIKTIHGDIFDFSNFKYSSMKESVTLGCKKHGNFSVLPNSLIYGKSGCPSCGRERSEQAKLLSFDTVLDRCKEVHGDKYDYSKIEEYTTTEQNYTITCKKHGEFSQKMTDHLSGRGCKECGRESMINKRKLSKEDFVDRAFSVQGNKFNYDKFKYTNYSTKSTVICEEHGEFEVSPLNHLKGTNCPKCAKKVSRSELEIREFLQDKIECEFGNRKLLGNSSEVDIFIPSKKVGIEFNGLYFHSDKFQDSDYHLQKTNKANINSIRLIHIFEDEWLYKKDIVKSRLLNILSLVPNKIHARKCEIREVDTVKATKFLKENHIQGSVGAKVKIGLYYNNELVSLMTFGDLRKSLGQSKEEGSWELLRFCNKLNTTVVGGASKLLKHFEEEYQPITLISYADRRWSEGGLYKILNFEEVHKTKPNYFYTKGSIRESRFAFRKDVLVSQGYDKNKTEKEIMRELGYLRIYDCGTIKFKKEYV